MSLTHPSPFAWQTTPHACDWSDVYSLSASRQRKSEQVEKRRNSGEVSRFLETSVAFQPPHFRLPKAKSLVPKSRYRPVENPRSAQPRPDSISGQLRALLEARGPMTRMEMSKLTGVKSARVGDLMKQDKRVLLDKTVFPQRYYVASNPPVGVVA